MMNWKHLSSCRRKQKRLLMVAAEARNSRKTDQEEFASSGVVGLQCVDKVIEE